MTNAVAVVAEERGALAEQVAVDPRRAVPTPQQRMAYYSRVCESLGINPYTQPFQYIRLNNKLVLYATRTAADQLRKRNGEPGRARHSVCRWSGYRHCHRAGRRWAHRHGNRRGSPGQPARRGPRQCHHESRHKGQAAVDAFYLRLGRDETEVGTIRDARPVTVTDDGEIVDESPPRPSSARRNL